MVVIHVSHRTSPMQPASSASGTHHFTRELVLRSVEEHSLLIAEIAQKLNTILDVPAAVQQVTTMLQRAMGVDACEMLLREDLQRLVTSDLTDPLARKALQNKTAEVAPTRMFVPILINDQVVGLISMHKTRSGTARSTGVTCNWP